MATNQFDQRIIELAKELCERYNSTQQTDSNTDYDRFYINGVINVDNTIFGVVYNHDKYIKLLDDLEMKEKAENKDYSNEAFKIIKEVFGQPKQLVFMKHPEWIWQKDITTEKFMIRNITLNKEEIQSFIAHELGHVVHRDVSIMNYYVHKFISGMTVFVPSAIALWKRNPRCLLSTPIGYIANEQYHNYKQRQQEYRADAFVVKHFPELKQPLISGLSKFPPEITLSKYIFGFSHPGDKTRIEAINNGTYIHLSQ